MTIGTLGRNIVFEVSDETALILQEMTRETSGRCEVYPMSRTILNFRG